MLFFKNLPEELRHEIVLFFRDPYGEEKRKLMEEIRFYGKILKNMQMNVVDETNAKKL